jgi:hypothetical protein
VYNSWFEFDYDWVINEGNRVLLKIIDNFIKQSISEMAKQQYVTCWGSCGLLCTGHPVRAAQSAAHSPTIHPGDLWQPAIRGYNALVIKYEICI